MSLIGSPNWLEGRTFSFKVVIVSISVTKEKPRRIYRNPIHLAKEYKRMIDEGTARNESDLARQIGISRVRVNHFITLLNLAPEVIEAIEEIGDPMPKRYITERRLRSILKLQYEDQKTTLQNWLSV